MRYFLFVFFFGLCGYAQTISKQVFGSTGGLSSNGSVQVNSNLGEPIIGLMTSDHIQLGNGYFPSMLVEPLDVDDLAFESQIQLYPNPTSGLVELYHPTIDFFTIQISDVHGKLLQQQVLLTGQTFDLSGYAQGIYLVTVKQDDHSIKNTFKIIKR